MKRIPADKYPVICCTESVYTSNSALRAQLATLFFLGLHFAHLGFLRWSFASGWASDRRQSWCKRNECELKSHVHELYQSMSVATFYLSETVRLLIGSFAVHVASTGLFWMRLKSAVWFCGYSAHQFVSDHKQQSWVSVILWYYEEAWYSSCPWLFSQ